VDCKRGRIRRRPLTLIILFGPSKVHLTMSAGVGMFVE
jgi:hypothetical protein